MRPGKKPGGFSYRQQETDLQDRTYATDDAIAYCSQNFFLIG